MRKLKILFSAIFLVVFFASVLPIAGCKKTYTTVVQDSIYYSTWTPLAMQFNNTDSLWFQDFNNSKITAKIIDHGVVLGYFASVNGTDTTVSNASEWPTYLGVLQQLQVGVLDLSSYYNLSYPGGDVPFLYRYVIIPANVVANTSLKDMSKDQLSKMKFTDLQKVVSNAQTSSGNRPSVSGN